MYDARSAVTAAVSRGRMCGGRESVGAGCTCVGAHVRVRMRTGTAPGSERDGMAR